MLETISSTTSSRISPLSAIRTAGMRMPSAKCSFADTSNEPGTLPPTSAQWPLDCENAIRSPSWKIGRMMRTSLKCVPPA